jgi:ligand-binding SRPBCC domain-containing protein
LETDPAVETIQFSKLPTGEFRLTAQQWLPRRREELFPFFADAGNLETITPPTLSFSVLNPPPIVMRAGLLIDYKLRLRGLPLRWQSEITVWDPPNRFVDEQRKGPYRVWHHEHVFTERDGGTLATDNVRYAVFGGALIERLFVRRDLTKIFTYRQRKLAEIFK